MESTAPRTTEESDLLTEIQQLYDEAEGHMKLIEHSHGLYIPTVNQLRYAGRHLIDFFNGSPEGVEELRKAKRHCQRGVYDANDAHIQYYIMEVEGFIEDFKDVEISDVFKEYPELIKAKNSANDFLENTRDDDDSAEESLKRDKFYQKAVEHKLKLKSLCEDLPIHREELNKRVRKERRNNIWTWINSIVGIIGFIATVCAFFI